MLTVKVTPIPPADIRSGNVYLVRDHDNRWLLARASNPGERSLIRISGSTSLFSSTGYGRDNDMVYRLPSQAAFPIADLLKPTTRFVQPGASEEALQPIAPSPAGPDIPVRKVDGFSHASFCLGVTSLGYTYLALRPDVDAVYVRDIYSERPVFMDSHGNWVLFPGPYKLYAPVEPSTTMQQLLAASRFPVISEPTLLCTGEDLR